MQSSLTFRVKELEFAIGRHIQSSGLDCIIQWRFLGHSNKEYDSSSDYQEYNSNAKNCRLFSTRPCIAICRVEREACQWMAAVAQQWPNLVESFTYLRHWRLWVGKQRQNPSGSCFRYYSTCCFYCMAPSFSFNCNYRIQNKSSEESALLGMDLSRKHAVALRGSGSCELRCLADLLPSRCRIKCKVSNVHRTQWSAG